MKQKIKVNQLVEIEYAREGWAGVFRTRVEDIKEEILVLGIPYVKGGLLPLKQGDEIGICFWDQVAVTASKLRLLLWITPLCQ